MVALRAICSIGYRSTLRRIVFFFVLGDELKMARFWISVKSQAKKQKTKTNIILIIQDVWPVCHENVLGILLVIRRHNFSISFVLIILAKCFPFG